MSAIIEHAAARAILARFIASAFCEPEAALPADLRDGPRFEELCRSARVLGVDARLCGGTSAAEESVAALSDRFAALFGHAVRGDCPPYEMEYARGEVFQQAHVLADIAGFYRAFGVGVGAAQCERGDHVAAEWEFLSLCAWKEAQAEAWKSGAAPAPAGIDPIQAAATCRDAQRAFLRDHAAAWMPAFFARVQKADGDAFFGRCAALGERLLRAWCDEFDATYGPAWLDLRPVDDEDMTIECGPGSEAGRATLGPGLAAAIDG